MMHYSALIALGFVSGGFIGGGPISIGSGVGVPTSGDFMSPVVYSQSADARASAAPAGITITTTTPKDFPFVTIVQDDGKGKAGGWQGAKVNLEFVRIVVPTDVIVWHCPFNIEMPLRTEFMGKVDASRAASFSVEITNRVSQDMDYKLPQGIFCEKFIVETRAAFKSKYPLLGAAVIK